MMKALIFAAAAVLTTVAVAPAQDAAAEGKRPGRRPAPPLIAALDTNKDGVIDADEIAKSPEALKSLDRDADGKLSREEVAPDRRGGKRGEGRKRGPKPDAAQ